MKTIVNVLVACCTLMLATACALLSPLNLDPGAREAAGITLQTYAVLQQAVLVYGYLPDCTTPPVVHICRQHQAWRRLQTAERAATQAIAAAAPVLNATEIDTGQIVAALGAIETVREALAEAQSSWNRAAP
ncbi:MAG: hypothetical protein ABL973_21100 [Micropepsaceae bacterium]